MSGMPWYRLYRNIKDSADLLDLEARIGEAALAHIVKWWCNVADQRPSGDLTGISDAVIERWADWRGTRGELVKALRETGWLDADNTVHGWKKRQEALAEKFERDAQRPNAKQRKPRADPVRGPDETPRGPPADPARERRGEESRGEEEERESAPPVAAAPRRPGTPREQTIFGAAELASMPKTPEEVLADRSYGPLMVKKFAVIPRDDLLIEIRSDLESFQKRWREKGRDSAYSGIISWIRRRVGPYEAAARFKGTQSSPIDENDPVQKRAWKWFGDEKRKGVDLPPFAEWYPANAHRFEQAKPAAPRAPPPPENHPADDGPIDVVALVREGRARARAGPASGGTETSGTAATPTAG